MDVDGCPLPEDRRYATADDVWYREENDGASATVGLTSLLASFAGRFHAVTFRPVEGLIDAGRSVATVESVRFTGAVRLPVRGRIVGRNRAISDRPKLLNDDPYGAGWVVRIEPEDPADARRTLPTAAAAREAFAARRAELGVRCRPAVPDEELIEVGAECAAILVRLGEAIDRRAPGEVVLLVTDDPTSPIEMVRWSDRTGHAVVHQARNQDLFEFLVRREADPHPRRR